MVAPALRSPWARPGTDEIRLAIQVTAYALQNLEGRNIASLNLLRNRNSYRSVIARALLASHLAIDAANVHSLGRASFDHLVQMRDRKST